MAVTQVGQIILRVLSTLAEGLDLSTVRDELDRKYAISLANGTGAGQANNVFHDQRTIAASGNEDLDLAAGLTNAFGDALTFTKVKAIIIKAAGGNTNNVVVTRPAENGVPFFAAASDAVAIKPGGLFVLVDPSSAGIAVTADTGDLINISNSGAGTGVTYDVIIIGTV